jgi:hypothetical protein
VGGALPNGYCASDKNILPFLPDQIGSIWNSEVQIDVAGVNFMDKTLILGECKWDRHLKDANVLEKLVEKQKKFFQRKGSGEYSIWDLAEWLDRKCHCIRKRAKDLESTRQTMAGSRHIAENA